MNVVNAKVTPTADNPKYPASTKDVVVGFSKDLINTLRDRYARVLSFPTDSPEV
jgi:hypothetical protein